MRVSESGVCAGRLWCDRCDTGVLACATIALVGAAVLREIHHFSTVAPCQSHGFVNFVSCAATVWRVCCAGSRQGRNDAGGGCGENVAEPLCDVARKAARNMVIFWPGPPGRKPGPIRRSKAETTCTCKFFLFLTWLAAGVILTKSPRSLKKVYLPGCGGINAARPFGKGVTLRHMRSDAEYVYSCIARM